MDLRFTLIPDSFKGMLSFSQICAVVDEKIKKHFPDNRIVSIPVAGGGEGSVDALIMTVGGVKEYVTVKNPYFGDVESHFRLIDGGQTAIIGVASCAGLPLMENRKDPRFTTAYGVGQLILAAAGKGVKKVTAGLGDSSISDDGCGAAAAASTGFYNRGGRGFVPTGGITADIGGVDLSGRGSLLEQVKTVTMCDIDSPMYEPAGASFIFGSQKGADEATVLQLDEGIRNLGRAIAQATGVDINQVSGTRVAGTMGVGMIAFLGFRLQMGIQTVLDMIKFGEIVGDASYILTGEEKLDSQNLQGKVVIGTAKRTNEQVKAVIAVMGGTDDDEIGKAYDMGVIMVSPINRLPQGFSASGHRDQGNLTYTVDNIVRLTKAGQGEH